MKKGTISLALIIKDETTELKSLFESLKESNGQSPFSEIVVAWNGSNPETKTILESYGCKVVPYQWEDDFAKAREFSFKHTQGEFIAWLDADDTLVGVDNFLQVCAEAFVDQHCYSIWMPYHYDHDKDGNVVMTLWRERVIRRDSHEWVGAIHECLLPVKDGHNFRTEKVYVKHNVDPSRVERGGERNLRISQKQYFKDKEENHVDPRNIYNYARSLDAVGRHKEAIPIFEEYIIESEWDDEKYQALLSLASLYTRSRQYNIAIEYCQQAMRMRPQYGQSYFQLAQIYFRMDRYEDVLHFCKIGFNSKIPTEILPTDPSEYSIKPALVYEFALFQLGRAQESLDVINKYLVQYPSNEALLGRKKLVERFLAHIELEKSALTLSEFLVNYEPEKIEPFLNALPKPVQDHPTFVRMSNDINAFQGGDNTIAIYCGPTFEDWGPVKLKKKGLGGSEEAVVYLSKELVKLGYSVDVYCNCDEEGMYDGVEYKNFWKWNSQPYSIFIAWRNNEYVDLASPNSRKFVWLHDVQKKEYWDDRRTETIEKVFVLSKWHRENVSWIPEDKIMYTRNGIVTSDFAVAGTIQRDPLKCVYASSPDRGLDILLELWKDIKKANPDAHLHLFYGFTETYDKLHANNSKMIKFKEEIMKMVESDPSIHWHGKVNHAELHEHFMTAGLWLYPTHFTEISCITAMKAQAAGMIPVCTTLAALDETVQHGYKIDFHISDQRARQAFVNITQTLLKDPEKQDKKRPEMMKWAKEHYSWSNVAKQWADTFSAV